MEETNQYIGNKETISEEKVVETVMAIQEENEMFVKKLNYVQGRVSSDIAELVLCSEDPLQRIETFEKTLKGLSQSYEREEDSK